MRTILIILLIGLCPNLFAQVSGSEAAIQLVDKMFETMGGKEVWKNARTKHVRLKGHHAGYQEVWAEEYWIDLEEPGGRYQITRGDTLHTIAWTRNSGWETKNGVFSKSTTERIAFEYNYWTREPYVVLHRLASSKKPSQVILDKENTRPQRFYVLDEKGDTLCWFAVNLNFELVKWGTQMDKNLNLEHVLGPLHDYGKFKAPYWGTTISGFWRYIHEYMELSKKAPKVSFTHPKENP